MFWSRASVGVFRPCLGPFGEIVLLSGVAFGCLVKLNLNSGSYALLRALFPSLSECDDVVRISPILWCVFSDYNLLLVTGHAQERTGMCISRVLIVFLVVSERAGNCFLNEIVCTLRISPSL